MRLIDKILENQPDIYKIYKKKRPFFQLENMDIKKVTKELFKNITSEIPIDEISGYRNEKVPNATFTHPDSGCKSNDEKNTITATKQPDGTFYAEPETNIERMIKLAWNKYKKDGECENQFPVPDTAENKGINIDLLIKKDDSIEFIELKRWDNGVDSPAFAIAEIIKNLYVFSHFYKHLFVFDYDFKKDFDIENYRKLYNLEGKNKFILTILAPEEYYKGYFENREIKNKKILKEKYIKFCSRLKKLIQKDLRKKLNKNDLEIEIRIKSFIFSKENQYEVIIEKLIKDKIEKNKKDKDIRTEVIKITDKKGKIKYTTGAIDLDDYFEQDNYFSKEVREQLITWSDYVKIT